MIKPDDYFGFLPPRRRRACCNKRLAFTSTFRDGQLMRSAFARAAFRHFLDYFLLLRRRITGIVVKRNTADGILLLY